MPSGGPRRSPADAPGWGIPGPRGHLVSGQKGLGLEENGREEVGKAWGLREPRTGWQGKRQQTGRPHETQPGTMAPPKAGHPFPLRNAPLGDAMPWALRGPAGQHDKGPGSSCSQLGDPHPLSCPLQLADPQGHPTAMQAAGREGMGHSQETRIRGEAVCASRRPITHPAVPWGRAEKWAHMWPLGTGHCGEEPVCGASSSHSVRAGRAWAQRGCPAREPQPLVPRATFSSCAWTEVFQPLVHSPDIHKAEAASGGSQARSFIRVSQVAPCARANTASQGTGSGVESTDSGLGVAGTRGHETSLAMPSNVRQRRLQGLRCLQLEGQSPWTDQSSPTGLGEPANQPWPQYSHLRNGPVQTAVGESESTPTTGLYTPSRRAPMAAGVGNPAHQAWALAAVGLLWAAGWGTLALSPDRGWPHGPPATPPRVTGWQPR